jgi:hypothetical protein
MIPISGLFRHFYFTPMVAAAISQSMPADRLGFEGLA